MTPSFCRHCGRPVAPGASFCGGCGNAVQATAERPVAPTGPAPVTMPAPPVAPTPGDGRLATSSTDRTRRVGRALLVGALAVVVMLGVGLGTAYLLTRDDDSSTDSAAGPDGGVDREDGGSPAEADTEPAGAPTATVTVTEGATTGAAEEPVADPESTLRDAIAADEAAVLALDGSWVPQLASISDDINGSWSAALAQYEELVEDYPDALVVDAGDWPHSFVRSDTFDTVLVVLLPSPASPVSAPVLEWCQLNRGDRQASCYAKLVETSGSPRDNTDQNRPEPEFN